MTLLVVFGAVLAPGVARLATPSPPAPVHKDDGKHAAKKSARREGTKPRTTHERLRDLLAEVSCGYEEKNGAGETGRASSCDPDKVPTVGVIATVPDPGTTSLDSYFDQALESIQAAAGDAHYLPDRFDLPAAWQGGGRARDPTVRIQSAGSGVNVSVVTDEEEDPRSVPGILLFRRIHGAPPAHKLSLLVVFLVGETPTTGIHPGAMHEALQEAASLGKQAATAGGAPGVYVLGPFFSGSSFSLRTALAGRARLDARNGTGLDVTVISGSADSETNAAMIAGAYPDKNIRVTFQYATTPVQQVETALFDYLEVGLGDRKVAMLVERGTGWAQNLQTSPGDGSAGHRSLGHSFRFPLHVAQLRAAREHEEDGKAEAEALRNLRKTMELHLDQEYEGSGELPTTSSLTPFNVELTLREELETIAHEHDDMVVIEATDPADAVFVAREARKYCPGVQLVVLAAEELYSHPDLMSDLNGLIVGSTYPLFGALDGWTAASDNQMRAGFASQAANGIYNAFLGLLSAAKVADDTGSWPYRNLRSPFLREQVGPQIWVSIVNNGAIWPIATTPPKPTSRATPATLLTPNSKTADVFGPPRHHVGLDAGAFYFLFCAIGLVLGITLCWRRSREVERRRGTLSGREAVYLGVLVVALLLLCSYLFGLARATALDLSPMLRAVASLALVAAALSLLLGGFSLAGPFWTAFTEPAVPPERPADVRMLSHLSRVILIAKALAAAGAVGLTLLFIVRIALPSETMTRWHTENFALFRTLHPLSGVSPGFPLILLLAAFLLWAYGGYRSARDHRRAPPDPPFPHKEDIGTYNLGALASRLTNPDSALLAEVTFLAIVMVPAFYVFGRMTRTVEDIWFDRAFQGLAILLVGAIATSTARLVVGWKDLGRLLRRLAHQPMATAYGRISASRRVLGLQIGAEVTLPEELEEATRIASLVGADWKRGVPVLPVPPPPHLPDQEILSLAAARVVKTYGEETAGEPIDPRRGTEANLFRMSRMVFSVLEYIWCPTFEGGPWSAPRDSALERQPGGGEPGEGRRRNSSLDHLREALPSGARRCLEAAEELVARQVTAMINRALARLRRLTTFAIVGAVLLLFSVACYPFQPNRLLLFFAAFIAVAAIVPAIWVIVGAERDEILSRIADTEPGRIELGGAFLSQIFLVAVVPGAALVCVMFPAARGTIFDWLAPVFRAIH